MLRTTESRELTTADLAKTANDRDRLEADIQQDNAEDQYSSPLLTSESSQELRTRWEAIQTAFIDDPRVSVQRADELVATAIKKLAELFADERAKLEHQWSRGGDVSTEDMRQALRRYRAFFQRLLSV